MNSQVQFGKDIQRWLRVSFPEFADHPAAVATVIRLRFLVGRGRVTRAEHGDLIRAAVEHFDAENGLKEGR